MERRHASDGARPHPPRTSTHTRSTPTKAAGSAPTPTPSPATRAPAPPPPPSSPPPAPSRSSTAPEPWHGTPSGNMYVMDTGNKCVRQVTPETAGVAGTIDDVRRHMHGHRRIHRRRRPRAHLREVEHVGVGGSPSTARAMSSSPTPATTKIRRITAADGKITHDRGDRHRRHQPRHGVSPAATGRMSNPSGNRRGVGRQRATSPTARNDRMRRLVCNATPCLRHHAPGR